jgi:hypothetical protein
MSAKTRECLEVRGSKDFYLLAHVHFREMLVSFQLKT